MRAKGLKETGVNTVLRCANAYLHWKSGSERKCGPGCTHPRIAQLKEPRLVMPTFTEQQVKRLITWKPKGKYHRRLHVLILFLLDTGCRISEALGLRTSEVDFDNLLVTLDGKGRKQRVVPISFELRKVLFRFCMDTGSKPDALLFASRTGSLWSRRNILRDVKRLCRNLGITPPGRTLHAFRHTFAVNYLRRGGSVFHLQKVLGHSTLEMTRRYANLVTADLRGRARAREPVILNVISRHESESQFVSTPNVDMKNIDRIVEALESLRNDGAKLLDEGQKPDMSLGNFAPSYEVWYSKALSAVGQICPSRLPEFKEAYRHEKRKAVTYDTYAVSDFLMGLTVTFRGEPTFNKTQAFATKLLRQIGIVQSAEQLAQSVLFDIRGMLRAELLDADLDAAKELLRAKHLRSAGMICGVVLETHLKSCCDVHGLTVTKKDPGIGDLNELLKAAGLYDVPTWRLIQRLADIRNLCGHRKDRDPRTDEVEDLVAGTEKVIKEVG